MKTCLLTGHTSGLGMAIFEHLLAHDWEVEGCSRRNGFNISDPSDRKSIIEKSLNAKVFINNASEGYSQTDLLFELFNEWKKCGKSGRILNIGSRAAIDYKFRSDPPVLYDYQKVSLRALCETLSLQNQIAVSCIHFAYIETERIKSRSNLTGVPMLSVQYAAEVVHWAISQPDHVVMPEVQIRAMRSL